MRRVIDDGTRFAYVARRGGLTYVVHDAGEHGVGALVIADQIGSTNVDVEVLRHIEPHQLATVERGSDRRRARQVSAAC